MHVSYNVTLEIAPRTIARGGFNTIVPTAFVTVSTEDKTLLGDLVDAIGVVNDEWSE